MLFPWKLKINKHDDGWFDTASLRPAAHRQTACRAHREAAAIAEPAQHALHEPSPLTLILKNAQRHTAHARQKFADLSDRLESQCMHVDHHPR